MDAIIVSKSKPPISAVRTVYRHHSVGRSPRSVVSFGSSSGRRTWQSGSLSCCRKARRKISVSIVCGAGIREIDETQFEEAVLKSDGLVLVEFVATWCGPCRLIAPAMEWVAQEYKDKLTVVKIDHDANPKLIEEYKVYGLPALILFKNGKEVPESRREGAITKVKLKAYLDLLLESTSVV